MKRKQNRVLGFIKILLLVSGSVFILLCVLAFTKIPFYAYYNLGTGNSRITHAPETIVLLSGNSIPSESGLMRAYYTSRLALENPGAKVIISMPGNLADSLSAPQLTARELEIRGIQKNRISFENSGRNTREQALKLAEGKTPAQLKLPVTLVTSPEQMKRSVLVFRKCGFTTVSGKPTFEFAITADITFSDSDLKGNKFVPPIGNNMQVRYQFWSHLKLEVLVIREYFGLAYYKLRGWI